MSVITVDVRETRHTCPANHAPHAVYRQHTVVSTVDGGPCRTPVTVRIGDHIEKVACERHEPAHRRCIACATLLIVRNVTHTDLGWQGPDHLRTCKHRPPCLRSEVAA
jgi:hypothetical protein